MWIRGDTFLIGCLRNSEPEQVTQRKQINNAILQTCFEFSFPCGPLPNSPSPNGNTI